MNRKEMQIALSKHLRTLGGEGSGNFGHAGIPGQVGGSMPGDGGTGIKDTSNAPKDGFKTEEQLYGVVSELYGDQLKNINTDEYDHIMDIEQRIRDDIEEVNTVVESDLVVDTSKLESHPEIDKYEDYNYKVRSLFDKTANEYKSEVLRRYNKRGY